MKKIFLIMLLFAVGMGNSVFAKTFNVVVLPVSSGVARENYYNFQNVDEIISTDIIKNFNSSYKIHALSLYEQNLKLNADTLLKNRVSNALDKFKTSNTIDYPTMKLLSNLLDAHSVLLIYSYIENPKTHKKSDVWDVLNISSCFNITQKYDMKVEAVLLDNVNDLVMWSGTYEFTLSDNNNNFQAKNYVQAIEQLQKIEMFSSNLLSKTISQNITLRFYPKSIRPVDVKPVGEKMDSGILKFNKNVPTFQRPEKLKDEEDTDEFNEKEYGEMIFGL